MRNVCDDWAGEARETERQIRQGRSGAGKIASVQKFGIVAKALWPIKTAAQVAAIANTNERTAARWLAGEFEPPGIVLAAIFVEITRRT